VARRLTKPAQDLYDALAAEQLERPKVGVGRALQNDVLKIDEKIFAFLKDERLVVKLPAAQAAMLVAAREAVPFESGGRKMKEWVSVGGADENRWRGLMDDARTYVAALAGRQRKPSRSR
jgi:hypothetical protein